MGYIMDCCFNKLIPKGCDKKIVVRPNSKTFVTGLSASYDESFPGQLKGRMAAEEWSGYMGRINEALFFYWPCFMCLSFGYCFACCTLGGSLCFPGMRVREAKVKVRKEIDDINKECLGKGIKWKLVEKCSTSWIEIDVEEMLALDTDNSQL